MSNSSKRRYEETHRYGFLDIWQLVFKIIIILLVIIWFYRDYIYRKVLDPYTILLLIIIIIILIWIVIKQRHIIVLRCSLTAPSNCVRGYTNILSGIVLEPIIGGAYGLGFSHYLIEVQAPGGLLLSDVVIYPDGGSNPDQSQTQGNFPVASGTLGWIDVEKAVTDAGISLLITTTFKITLRVFGVDGSELPSPCTTSFDISVNEVYIKKVSSAVAEDVIDPDEKLLSGVNPATIGGTMHVRGAADVYGCMGEKIKEYTIWAIPAPSFSYAQPAPVTSVSPQPNWVQETHIEFTPQTIDGTSYTEDDVRAYNILDGDPNPDILSNNWGSRTEYRAIMVDLTLQIISWKVPALIASSFNSNSALLPFKLDPIHVGGTGKFTFLLQVIDTNGNQYYDVQRAWIDNEPIRPGTEANIDGIAGLAPCADLYTQTRPNDFKTVEIKGTAWDQLIDLADLTQPTSDNFGHYSVHFKKQGATGLVLLIDSLTPIPMRPDPIGVGTLAAWDLSSLDSTLNPLGLSADQLLDRGEKCTYDIILQVWDKTIVSESGVHRSGWITWPIEIINSHEPGT